MDTGITDYRILEHFTPWLSGIMYEMRLNIVSPWQTVTRRDVTVCRGRLIEHSPKRGGPQAPWRAQMTFLGRTFIIIATLTLFHGMNILWP